MPNLYIARQPIYDRTLKVIAYELLYRDNGQDHAKFVNSDTVTTQVVINTFLTIGLENLAGVARRAFINVTRSFLLENSPMPFPKEHVVLELMEDIIVDDDVIAACQRLVAAGHTIALGNFVFNESLIPLLKTIQIVKINVLALGVAETRRQVAVLQPFKVKVLAEKIESHEVFEQCQALNVNYFQGYFLARPNLIKQQRPPITRLTALRTLSILQNPHAEIKELEKLITQDVVLSYKLLRYINSVAVSLPNKVSSIHQALIITGAEYIRLWASMLVLSDISEKPLEIMTIALARAKMCELLAIKLHLADKDSFFTIGLFSTLDALMDQPLRDILASLPLSDVINNALLSYQGQSGEVLRTVLAYEEGLEMEEIKQLGLTITAVKDIYLEALQWADNNIKSLSPTSA